MLKHLDVTDISKGHFCIQYLTMDYVIVMYYTRKTENQKIITQENLEINTFNLLHRTSLDTDTVKEVHSTSSRNSRISVTGQEGARSHLVVPKN